MPGYVTAPPPPSAGVAGLVGALVLIDVIAFHPQTLTQFGVKDEIEITCRVVDFPEQPSRVGEVTTTKAWNVMLLGQLRTLVGQTTLGRLVMGQARNGNNAPIRLDPPTQADQQAADRFLEATPPPPAPVAVQPVAAPAAAPPAGYPAAPAPVAYGAAQPAGAAPAGYPPPPPGWPPAGQPEEPPF